MPLRGTRQRAERLATSFGTVDESFDPLSGDYRQRRVVTAVLIRVD